MANYYGGQGYGPSNPQNLQFFNSDYNQPVSGHATPSQASYGYGAPQSGGFGGSFTSGFGSASGVSGRMDEQGGLRTGWVAALFTTEGYDGEPGLLEELGVDFGLLQRKTLAVLNPFARIDQHLMDDSDLAGPILFFMLVSSPSLQPVFFFLPFPPLNTHEITMQTTPGLPSYTNFPRLVRNLPPPLRLHPLRIHLRSSPLRLHRSPHSPIPDGPSLIRSRQHAFSTRLPTRLLVLRFVFVFSANFHSHLRAFRFDPGILPPPSRRYLPSRNRDAYGYPPGNYPHLRRSFVEFLRRERYLLFHFGHEGHERASLVPLGALLCWLWHYGCV